jgi:hypothetical protein
MSPTFAAFRAHLIGVTPMKPGSCAFPYYGIEFAIVDPKVKINAFPCSVFSCFSANSLDSTAVATRYY